MARKSPGKAPRKTSQKAARKAEHPLKGKLTRRRRRIYNALKEVVGDEIATMAFVELLADDPVEVVRFPSATSAGPDKNAAKIEAVLEALIKEKKLHIGRERFVIIRGRGHAIVIRIPSLLLDPNTLHRIAHSKLGYPHDQLHKLYALQTTVGEDIARKVFERLLAQESPSRRDKKALQIAALLDPLIKARKLRIRRGGYAAIRFEDRVVVEPYSFVYERVTPIWDKNKVVTRVIRVG